MTILLRLQFEFFIMTTCRSLFIVPTSTHTILCLKRVMLPLPSRLSSALRTCLELRYLSLCAAHSLGLELLNSVPFSLFLHFKSHLLFRVIYPDHLSKNLVTEYFFLSVKIRERNQDSSNNLNQLNTWPNTWNEFRHWTSGSQCN